jgi:hypothetical protein
MVRNLTEEQTLERDEIFFTILDDFITENFDVPEDYEMNEEEELVVSIMWEHFAENYREPTLNEAVIQSVTGRDVNQDLFDELYEALMDESIGGFIAGARHGIQNKLRQFSVNRAAKKTGNAAAKATSAGIAAQKAAKAHANAKYGSGVIDRVRKGFAGTKVKKAQQKAAAAKSNFNAADRKERSARQNLTKGINARNTLKRKIDTGIGNSAEKVGAFAGRFAE